ncbi:fumarylacetoacetate hydrolase family protein [Candidatus Nitrosocosmicus agrestis]|jgi:2-keto-4-pentenoate hydratase/2-oxohepta-3-ene-1,7-dioic acid hydratase in catechol pathway|uniref:fumarylacetoacetate hydrolase family protein n=1 Tax=Candidatus Nitrosocosmicus agrestis TaxID=2563600 RepID=UPI00122E2B81|nr:fumarylacetoacetate hydrolase family protein [Candidatus Nitrosocosmicus sp. SS]KAA2279736.1 fumarylacetoacetate hydrolase family protein [Candidatus Nitrosocosmicus sp. SS]KAF0868808.1 fumarylacetoacetate hydrolase family protein [Candidatus Nitrosocosmicus sp. SS]
MKIARIRLKKNSMETYGIVSDDFKRIITKEHIQEDTGIPIPPKIKEFLFDGWLAEITNSDLKMDGGLSLEEVELLAPLPDPPKIICLAFNYYDHARDAGLTPSEEPVIFLKPRTALNTPHGDVISPSYVKRLDYEAEIAVVMGSQVKKVSEEQSLDSIFGYMVFHDVSARDIQFRDKQFTRGKGIDTFAPCGPWITTKDEIKDPQNLRITTKVNGEIRQNSSSSNMVIPIKKIISSLSNLMTIEPGDIISTGTPAGVAMSMKEPRYLKQDDIVEISIECLGTIRNKIQFV